MKIFNKKWASLMLIMTLLISALPTMTASAAGTITITNLYTVNPPSVYDDSLVDRVTQGTTPVNVTINGITDDQINSIYYEVVNENTGQITSNTTNKAVRNPSNKSEIYFNGVNLTEGKNKITIKYGQTGGVISNPAYVYYTPVSNIAALKFNDDSFVDGGTYPSHGPYTGINITGTANNAVDIEANLGGAVYQRSAFASGIFTFVTNTGRTTDMEFNPGDNKVTFAARNQSNFFTMPRTFAYDNGKAFAYNTVAKLKGGATFSKLVDNPTFETVAAAPVADIDFETDIKVHDTVSRYVYMDIFTSAGNNYHYDFDSNTQKVPTLSDNTPATPSLGSNLNVTLKHGSTLTEPYRTFNVKAGQLPVNKQKSTQELFFVFTDMNGATSTSKYVFSYVDKDQPYVSKLNSVRSTPGGGATYETTISEGGSTQITNFPAALKVYTNDQATGVIIKINGIPYNETASITNGEYAVTGGPGAKSATLNLQGITDGPVVLTVTPYKTTSANTYAAGAKQYNLVITSAPYVIINQLYNGIVVKAATMLTCASGGTAPCISGRIVNIAADADYDAIVYKINGNAVPVSTSPKGNGGIFKLDNLASVFVKDGKYTLTIELKVSGQLVTTTTMEIFVLSDNVPSVDSLQPFEADTLNPEFIKDKSLPDTYVTKALGVRIIGKVVNSTVQTPPTPGTALYVRKAPFAISANERIPLTGTDSFDTGSYFQLKEFGQYVFEIVSTNAISGTTANKILTITREPAPYTFVHPTSKQIIKNAKNLDQANINQNYYMIELEAAQADSVVFGKEEAIYDKVTKHFFYEVKNLKIGANEVKFTVNRGTSKLNGSIVLFNTNVTMVGAQIKAPLGNSIKVFDGDVQFTFPKDTKLMRYDRNDSTQYVSTDRQILFGIASNEDGRVDRTDGADAVENRNGMVTLAELTGRFRPASKRYWVDAGIIKPNANGSNSSLQDAYMGSGYLPNLINGGTSRPAFNLRDYRDVVVPTKTGSLTLKYDSNIVNDAWRYLTVYQYTPFEDPNGSGLYLPKWKNVGGKVDPSKSTITVPVDSFGYFQVMYMDNSFNDVTNHPWARNDLDILYSKGYMDGKTDGLFMPNDAISRGEFVTMLVDIFNVPLRNADIEEGSQFQNQTGTFLDVQKGYSLPGSNNGRLFDYQHIEAAARAGIIRGNANGLFLPNNSLSRQDAAVMIARAADLKLTSDETKSMASLKKTFTDADVEHMELYAAPAVEAVNKAKLIEGIENALLEGQKKKTYRYDARETFTRAQAAAVAVRVLKQQSIIPK
ncbi:S-layer homology domain-containing protein [Paenibacillus sp. SYP-B3998]|uniref:S-layer homology domain-containing protein n=1 Tax=Paenibacillus sp. SYP-B3998 TaxID=2678564 RepID=A0A6G4A3G5_9BACL|nr:S-layer homology domain-containing protein [Paenibacillus sp. SYP-B3998]NEW08870.1 S-layer homology domain-containing protein [Paenibacillus sp. SYP-B3998]